MPGLTRTMSFIGFEPAACTVCTVACMRLGARVFQAMEADRERDLALRELGYDVIRLTYRQVTDKPAETASAIRTAIATRSRPGEKVGHSPIKTPGSL